MFMGLLISIVNGPNHTNIVKQLEIYDYWFTC